MKQCRRNVKKTTGLISKKATLHKEHTFFWTFLCRCFVRLQHETSRNFLVTCFMKELLHIFLLTFFTTAPFHLALVAARIPHFLPPLQKNASFVFISRSRSLSPFFSLSFTGLPPTFSFSLSFSCSIFQICGRDN